jgi:hypothetical protein
VAKQQPEEEVVVREREMVAVADLKPHPRNYRRHTPEQLMHLEQSLREHGFYRNIVVAEENTILGGHGIVEAAQLKGVTTVPVVRLPYPPDDPRALKVLAGDNEILHFAEVDDRALSEILKEVRDADLTGLLGTGFDDAQLANLVFVTRGAHELAGLDAAAEWVGMPEYEPQVRAIQLTVFFDTPEDREKALGLLDITHVKRYETGTKTWSTWWPDREMDDAKSILFDAEDRDG